jgi:hypothetical protein
MKKYVHAAMTPYRYLSWTRWSAMVGSHAIFSGLEDLRNLRECDMRFSTSGFFIPFPGPLSIPLAEIFEAKG